jgi:hypothetical protein
VAAVNSSILQPGTCWQHLQGPALGLQLQSSCCPATASAPGSIPGAADVSPNHDRSLVHAAATLAAAAPVPAARMWPLLLLLLLALL